MASTFAFVHGAWHGAWCWERVVALLRERGHAATAVDLPCEDPDAGLVAYAETIASALTDAGDDVIVVAHSLGGLPAPLVATIRPVRAIVYLSALVPLAGASMADQSASSPERILMFQGGRETDERGRTRWTDVRTTARVMYPDLSAADARWAFARLRRQGSLPFNEPLPTRLPRVAVASLVCADDQMVNPAWSRRISRERLGVEPIELPTGHFSMITAPGTLVDALEAQAARG